MQRHTPVGGTKEQSLFLDDRIRGEKMREPAQRRVLRLLQLHARKGKKLEGVETLDATTLRVAVSSGAFSVGAGLELAIRRINRSTGQMQRRRVFWTLSCCGGGIDTSLHMFPSAEHAALWRRWSKGVQVKSRHGTSGW